MRKSIHDGKYGPQMATRKITVPKSVEYGGGGGLGYHKTINSAAHFLGGLPKNSSHFVFTTMVFPKSAKSRNSESEKDTSMGNCLLFEPRWLNAGPRHAAEKAAPGDASFGNDWKTVKDPTKARAKLS